MSSVALAHRKFTPQEYLTIERKAEFKSEFLDGDIYAMAGASSNHTIITSNLTGEIHSQIKGTPCLGTPIDTKVWAGKGRLYAYPDYIIVCGDRRYLDSEQDVLLNPTVIIEVLSPSTQNYDRTTKFTHYKRIETLQEYILVAQDKPHIERFVRKGDKWEKEILTGLDAVLSLSVENVKVSLKDIYERIVFPSP